MDSRPFLSIDSGCGASRREGVARRSDAPQRRRFSRCLRRGEAAEIDVIRRPPVKARMRPFAVVEPQIAAERTACLGHTAISLQIYLLILHRSPQPLDEHVVAPPSPSIHAD